MKLYDVPNNTIVRRIDDGDHQDEFKFHHIDGMYSYCHDQHGNVVHYPAGCEVEIIPGWGREPVCPNCLGLRYSLGGTECAYCNPQPGPRNADGSMMEC